MLCIVKPLWTGSKRVAVLTQDMELTQAQKKPDFSGFLELVGTTRFELVTPAMSTQCSTAELRALKSY